MACWLPLAECCLLQVLLLYFLLVACAEKREEEEEDRNVGMSEAGSRRMIGAGNGAWDRVRWEQRPYRASRVSGDGNCILFRVSKSRWSQCAEMTIPPCIMRPSTAETKVAHNYCGFRIVAFRSVGDLCFWHAGLPAIRSSCFGTRLCAAECLNTLW